MLLLSRLFLTSSSARLWAIAIVFLSTFLTLERQKSSTPTLYLCSLASTVDLNLEQAWRDASESRFLSIHRSSSERLSWLTEILKLFQQTAAFGIVILVTQSAFLVLFRELSSRLPSRLCDQARHARSGVQLV